MLVLDPPDRPSSFLYAVFLSGGKIFEWQYTTAPATVHFFVYSAPAPLTPLAQSSAGVVVQDVPPPLDPNLGMSAVAFDSTFIYEASPGTTTGGVARKKLDGTEPTGAAAPLFALPGMDPGLPAGGGLPVKPASVLKWKGIVVDGTAAYLAGTTTANGGSYPYSDSTAIYAISPFPPAASTQATKVTGLDKLGDIFSDLRVANGHLFWFDNSVDSSKRSLFTAPVGGGTPIKLEDDVFTSDHSAIASDTQFVYWTISGSQGKVRRCPLANLVATAATDVTNVESSAEGLTVDDGFVYFMTVDSYKTVWRAPKAGGTSESLGSMVLPPSHIGDRMLGVDAKYVYVSDSDGKLYRMPKVP